MCNAQRHSSFWLRSPWLPNHQCIFYALLHQGTCVALCIHGICQNMLIPINISCMFPVVRESVGKIHSLIPCVTSCDFSNLILALGLVSTSLKWEGRYNCLRRLLPGLNEIMNVTFPAQRKLWSLGMKSLIISWGWLHLCISYPVYDTVILCLCLVSRASLILVSGGCQTPLDSPVLTPCGYVCLMSAWLGSAIKQRPHKG